LKLSYSQNFFFAYLNEGPFLTQSLTHLSSPNTQWQQWQLSTTSQSQHTMTAMAALNNLSVPQYFQLPLSLI